MWEGSTIWYRSIHVLIHVIKFTHMVSFCFTHGVHFIWISWVSFNFIHMTILVHCTNSINVKTSILSNSSFLSTWSNIIHVVTFNHRVPFCFIISSSSDSSMWSISFILRVHLCHQIYKIFNVIHVTSFRKVQTLAKIRNPSWAQKTLARLSTNNQEPRYTYPPPKGFAKEERVPVVEQ